MRNRALATLSLLGVLALCVAGVTAPVGAATSQRAPTRGHTAQPRRIAVEPFVSKLSSYGGVLVWSHWDGRVSAFRLSARVRGRIEILPVAPRTVPFDVDLGPDPHGRAVAVYSRCAHEQPVWVLGIPGTRFAAPRGCVLYRYDFTTRRERRVAGIVGAGSGSFYLPTIWKNEIAYVRARDAGTPALFAQPLSAPRRHRIAAVALRAGPAGDPGPVALDLRAGQLAFAWDDAGGSQFDSGIYLDTFSPAGTGSTDVLDTETSDSRSPGLLGFPALSAGGLSYGSFDGSGITPNADAFDLIGFDGAMSARAAAPHALRAQARDGNTTYAMYGPYAGTFSNCGLAGCTLVAFVGLQYR